MSKKDVFKPVLQVETKDKLAVASTRKPSGPIPGGRAVSRVFQYNERRAGRAFTLRVHFDFDKSSDGDRERLKRQLKKILETLDG